MTVPQMVLMDEGPSTEFLTILRVINSALKRGVWTNNDRDEFLAFQQSRPSSDEEYKALRLVGDAINSDKLRIVVGDWDVL